MRISLFEIIVVGAVILLLFGSKLIPKIFKSGKESIKVAKSELEIAKKELCDSEKTEKE